MNADGIWKLFCETGDPKCYLAYKTAGRCDAENKENEDVPTNGTDGTAAGDPRIQT